MRPFRRTPQPPLVSIPVALLIVTLILASSFEVIAPTGHAEAVTGPPIAVGAHPSGISVDTITNRIYVANYGNNGTAPSTVSVINGSNNSLTATITVGINPSGVGVNSITDKIYVANYNSSNVSVITGISNATSTVNVGTHPSRIAVNTVTNEIYVTNSGDGTVSVINGTTNTVVNIRVGRSPVGIGLLPSTNEIFVSNSLDSTVSIIDGRTNSIITTIPTANDPGNIAVDNATNLVYVVQSNSSSGIVTVIDGSRNNFDYTIPVGAYPAGIDLNPLTNKIYVANSADSTVSVVDGYSATEVNTVSLAFGISPGAVGVNPVTNEIYVANAGQRTLSVISGRSTLTSVSCTPSSLSVNMSTACTATITDMAGSGATTPTGTVFFSSNGAGSFSPFSCTLSGSGPSATCSSSFTSALVGHHTIFGTYGGDHGHMSSSGSTTITVNSSTVGGMVIPVDKLSLLSLIALPVLLLLSGTMAVILLRRRLPRQRLASL